MALPWRTLIIDDEELARKRIKLLLANYQNDFLIVGEADNGDNAESSIESMKPDIIFLDIQMPGKNVFTMLSTLNHKPFVIFCTAFDQYALIAFDSHAVDYLVKPIEEERLKVTVNKLKKICKLPDNTSLEFILDAINTIQPKKPPTSIPYRIGDKTILVKLDSVVYFEAEDKYVCYYNIEGDKFISDKNLKSLEEKLPSNFIRISRSSIINIDFVKEVRRYFRGKVVFVMDDNKRTKLISGNSYSEEIKNAIAF